MPVEIYDKLVEGDVIEATYQGKKLRSYKMVAKRAQTAGTTVVKVEQKQVKTSCDGCGSPITAKSGNFCDFCGKKL